MTITPILKLQSAIVLLAAIVICPGTAFANDSVCGWTSDAGGSDDSKQIGILARINRKSNGADATCDAIKIAIWENIISKDSTLSGYTWDKRSDAECNGPTGRNFKVNVTDTTNLCTDTTLKNKTDSTDPDLYVVVKKGGSNGSVSFTLKSKPLKNYADTDYQTLITLLKKVND